MAQKKPLTDKELLAQLDGIRGPPSRATKAGASAGAPAKAPPASGDDPLAELEKLENLAKAKGPAALAAASSGSRPHSPKLAAVRTPASTAAASARNSEERAPASTRSAESTNAGLTPSSDGDDDGDSVAAATVGAASQKSSADDVPAGTGVGGGWWGGILATASAAVKQAEAAYKEIQHNQEAQRWADQVRGNVGALKNLGEMFVYVG